MAKFDFVKHLLGADSPITTKAIIASSETITVGDAVKNSSGYIAACDANDRILGIVVGIVDQNGIDLDNTSADNFDGTWTKSTKTYIASADNATDKKVSVLVAMDPYAVFENEADADLTAAMRFSFFSLVDEDQVDGDTNSATVGEMMLWELDPREREDAAFGGFRLVSWQGDSFEPET